MQTINFVVSEYTMSTNKPSFQQLHLNPFLTGFYLGSTANLVVIIIKWTASEEDIWHHFWYSTGLMHVRVDTHTRTCKKGEEKQIGRHSDVSGVLPIMSFNVNILPKIKTKKLTLVKSAQISFVTMPVFVYVCMQFCSVLFCFPRHTV